VVWKRVFHKRLPFPNGAGRSSPSVMPQFLPIVFELAYRETGETDFVRILREYEHQRNLLTALASRFEHGLPAGGTPLVAENR
jgi:hypothetical protein